MRKIIVVVFLPLIFAGCTVGPKYVRPAVQPPANFYTEQQATAASAADMAKKPRVVLPHTGATKTVIEEKTRKGI